MRRTTVLLAALGFLATGCSEETDARRKPTFPVKGKVLVNGQPAEEARVMLVPPGGRDSDQFTPNPYGRVKEDGTFELNTYTAGDGAPAGVYKATIEWRKSDPKGSRTRGPDLLAKKYSNPATSRFEVHVSEGVNELPPFELTVNPAVLEKLLKVDAAD
jgi:hypothetical protein